MLIIKTNGTTYTMLTTIEQAKIDGDTARIHSELKDQVARLHESEGGAIDPGFFLKGMTGDELNVIKTAASE